MLAALVGGALGLHPLVLAFAFVGELLAVVFVYRVLTRGGSPASTLLWMALILAAITSRKMKISELVHELPKYEIHKTTTPLAAEKLPAAYKSLEKHFADAQADRLDGLRLDWSDRWLIIRGSNTEPIVRIIAEAPQAAAAAKLCTDANAVLKSL